MTTPFYALEKIARHGEGIERLQAELRKKADNEHHNLDAINAISFDAANFVWGFLMLSGCDEAQQSREIRNSVATAIIDTLAQLGITDAQPLSFEEPSL